MYLSYLWCLGLVNGAGVNLLAESPRQILANLPVLLPWQAAEIKINSCKTHHGPKVDVLSKLSVFEWWQDSSAP